MKLDLTQSMQTKVLAMVVYSTEFLNTMRERLQPEHFPSKEQWTVCSLAYAYFDKFAVAPGDNISNEVLKYAKRTKVSDEGQMLILDLIDELAPSELGDESYVIEEVNKFIQHSEMRQVLEDFLPKFSSGEYDLSELTAPLMRIQSQKQEAEEGVPDVLAETWHRSVARMAEEEAPPIATLIHPLDAKMKGIKLGQVGTIMSPSGVGKSFFLVHLGKAALAQGMSVFHYTLEMSRDEIITRYDQMFIGATEEELSNSAIARKLAKRVRTFQQHGGALQVVYLAFGYGETAKRSKVEALRQDFRNRAARDGKPSLVIIDYGDLLATNGKNRYEEQGMVWRALKAFAVEENIAIWVATQSARSGVGVKRITELEVGDSYEKVRVSDIFIGFNRNIIFDTKNRQWEEKDVLHNERVVRLFVTKHRGRGDKYDVSFACDFTHGIFYSSSATMVLGDEIKGYNAEQELKAGTTATRRRSNARTRVL